MAHRTVRSTVHRGRLTCLLFLAHGLLGSGCGLFATFHDAKFQPPDGASGYEILLVPLRQSDSNFWYGESQIGTSVVDAVKIWARESGADCYFAEGPAAEEVLERVYDWNSDAILSSQWRQLAGQLGVQYVVEGDILNFGIESPQKVGLYDARATVHYRVIDVETGRIVHENKKLEATVGQGDETRFTTTTIFENPGMVRSKLIAAIGTKIGEELYGYYEE